MDLPSTASPDSQDIRPSWNRQRFFAIYLILLGVAFLVSSIWIESLGVALWCSLVMAPLFLAAAYIPRWRRKSNAVATHASAVSTEPKKAVSPIRFVLFAVAVAVSYAAIALITDRFWFKNGLLGGFGFMGAIAVCFGVENYLLGRAAEGRLRGSVR